MPDSAIDEYQHWVDVDQLILKHLKQIRSLAHYLRGPSRGYCIDSLRECANIIEKPLLKEIKFTTRGLPMISPLKRSAKALEIANSP